MKDKTGKLALYGIMALLLVLVIYIFLLRDIVVLAYEGRAPGFIDEMINLLYPRFEVEKHRFPLYFFLSKTDQIIFRMFFTGATILLGFSLLNVNKKFKLQFEAFWNKETSTKNTAVIRILYFTFLIIIFHDIYQDLMRLENASVFYKPITIYRILHVSFPSPEVILIGCILFFLSCILAIVNIYPSLSSTIAVLLFMVIQGFIFSFEKYDHGFATYTYAGLLIPFLLYEKRLAQQKGLATQKAWPLTLIVACICLSYFYTGLEKLFISGIDWINGKSLQSHLLTHETLLGKYIANHSILIILLANLTLITQIGFISILFKEKLKYFFIPAGFLFHIGVAIFMNVGGILNPWILTYIFFFDWSWVKRE